MKDKRKIEVLLNLSGTNFKIRYLSETIYIDIDKLDDLTKELSDLKAKLDKSKLAEREREKLAMWTGAVK